MSKAVRIRDHLYAEIEALAKTERRSLISQLEVLLEQALAMGDAGIATIHDGEELVGFAFPPEKKAPDPHFKPDFK